MAKPRAKTSIVFPGIGPVTERRLIAVGISSRATLRKLGAVKAYQRLKFRFGKDVTLNALYGLEAVIRECHWQAIPDARKAELKQAAKGSGARETPPDDAGEVSRDPVRPAGAGRSRP